MLRQGLHIFLLLVIFQCIAIGQRSSVTSMHMLNPYQNIQAYGGFDRSLSATMMYRSQWTPIQNNPKYFHLNAHLPVYLFDGAMGVMFENEELGLESNNLVKLSYNMVFNTNIGYFSAGLSAGFNQKRLNLGEAITPEGIYSEPVPQHNEPLFGNESYSSVAPVWSLSFLFKNEFLTGGLQLDNLYSFSHRYREFEYDASPKFTLFGEYNYSLSTEIKLLPSLMLVTNGKLLQVNLGLLVNYGNIFGGINVRGYSTNSFESVGILSGIRFNNHYTIAYSYDLGLTSLKNSTEGSHEIILKYNLNKILNTGLPPRIIYNPRDL